MIKIAVFTHNLVKGYCVPNTEMMTINFISRGKTQFTVSNNQWANFWKQSKS